MTPDKPGGEGNATKDCWDVIQRRLERSIEDGTFLELNEPELARGVTIRNRIIDLLEMKASNTVLTEAESEELIALIRIHDSEPQR